MDFYSIRMLSTSPWLFIVIDYCMNLIRYLKKNQYQLLFLIKFVPFLICLGCNSSIIITCHQCSDMLYNNNNFTNSMDEMYTNVYNYSNFLPFLPTNNTEKTILQGSIYSSISVISKLK